MSRSSPPDGFSREESLYLDGEMPDDAARRMGHRLAADPERADGVQAYREAMDVWREDAARTARSLGDGEAMADRVLASLTDGPRLAMQQASRAAPWYAAAAMLLIGVGIAGTLLSRPAPLPTGSDMHQADLVEFEEMVNLLIDSPDLSPRLASSGDSK